MGSTFFSKRYNPQTSRNRLKRQKTFKSMESANAYAKEHKLENFKVKQMTYATDKNSKYIIVKE